MTAPSARILACIRASTVVSLMTIAATARAGDRDVEWNPAWPKFRWSEGVATTGFLAASYLEDRYLPGPTTPNWTGAILLDNEIRGLLRGRSDHVQRAVSKYADIEYSAMTLFPWVDVAIALGVHQSPEVATQMFLINAQSLSFTSSVTLFTKWFVARQRPYARDCVPGGTVGIHGCGSSYDNISFFSGHTSATFTGAALTCVHHAHLPLYGGGLPDRWACAWALANASATAVMRIISDDHYASDVLFAAGIGFFSGYVMPSWLHYGFSGTPRRGRAGLPDIVPTLQPVVGGIGVGIAGSM
jgi:membrane-associated phospholipid phosphatase